MTITIDPTLEARLRERAEAEGLTIPAYIERLIRADQSAEEKLESLALEGLNSGAPIPVGPGYWEEQHLRLDDRLTTKTLIDSRVHAAFRESMEDFKGGRYSGPFDTVDALSPALPSLLGKPRGPIISTVALEWAVCESRQEGLWGVASSSIRICQKAPR